MVRYDMPVCIPIISVDAAKTCPLTAAVNRRILTAAGLLTATDPANGADIRKPTRRCLAAILHAIASFEDVWRYDVIHPVFLISEIVHIPSRQLYKYRNPMT